MTNASAGPSYVLHPVGIVRSTLTQRRGAPRQGDEGAPPAWIELDPAYAEALDGVTPGSEVILLTWLHEGRRETLRVHPRTAPPGVEMGVFATRSPDRPNPIGLHRATVSQIVDGCRLEVSALEAIDGTPVLDIKPVLNAAER
jgi:tRNA-Thr(GGU) m(6)t(6)A37 methyltransferase TsaA